MTNSVFFGKQTCILFTQLPLIVGYNRASMLRDTFNISAINLFTSMLKVAPRPQDLCSLDTWWQFISA
jgi:hypothetical protein